MATIRIGNDVFTVSPLGAVRSFELQADIWPPVTAALEEIAKGVAASGIPLKGFDFDKLFESNAVEIVAALSRGAAAFFRHLPREKLGFVLRELLGTAKKGTIDLFGPGEPFNTEMQGRTMDTWRLIIFSLQISYPDFFARLPALAARAGGGDGPSEG